MRLPKVVDEEQLDMLIADRTQVARTLGHVAESLGLQPLSAPVRGSALVGMNDAHVVKLMPPFERELASTEHACLRSLEGALPVPTPRLVDSGTLDGWNYVHMTRLAGQELKETWPSLTVRQKASIATQLGECLHTLHRLSAPAEIPRCDWPSWTAARLAVLQQSQQSAPRAWVEALPELLASADLTAREEGWLHTEVMLEHLLVSVDGEKVHLSGLFDFEPSWVGPVHYEYAAVAIFVSAGESSLLSEVLRAAGEGPIEPKRLFAMTMMHRYANLDWYKQRLGGPDDLDAWIQAFFTSTG